MISSPSRPARVRARQLRLLVRPVTRSITWVPLAVTVLIGAAIVANAARRSWSDADAMARSLRMAALVLAASAGFTIEDTAAPTIAGVPLPLSVRRALRVCVHLVALIPSWLALALLATIRSDGVPVAAFTLELVTCTTIVLASAAFLARGGRAGVGQLTAPVILVFALAAERLPERWTLFWGAPGTPLWREAHERWGWLLVVAGVALALLSLDPARREPFARRRATST